MKRFLTIISLCLLVNIVIAQHTTTEATQAANAVTDTTVVALKPTKSLLWEISGNELEIPSYLFGTIHMINKKDFILTDVMRHSLEKTDRITFEINMEEMMDITTLMPMMLKAFMNNGTTLKDLLSAEDYELVKTHFSNVGLPMMFFERIKPMFLSAMASEDVAKDKSESEIVSYEMELLSIAQEQEKEVGGLETAIYQMSMFDSIPYEVQAQMLVESIKAEDTGNDEFNRMVELYKNQDIEGMQEMIGEDVEGVARYEEILLINRNKNWIPIMSEMMRDKSTFFAVGAGHLGGEQGVIELLRAEGYKVKPIR